MIADSLDRRSFLAACGAFALGAARTRPAAKPVPLIHQTDLFRPHMDPDDHFDLACVFGLAAMGRTRLLGILCDAPPPGHAGDPDIAAVAMLNHLTGLSVPIVVGASQKYAGPVNELPATELRGVSRLLDALRGSPEPAFITVVGSCRDVALALRRDPRLFARKCRGIYLNAGTGTPDPRPTDQLEYNVALDPASYATVFGAPCPLYWMPCFERLGPDEPDAFAVHTHGTFYRFAMREVLAAVAPPMQRFFLSMLEHESGSVWLRSIHQPVDPAALVKWGALSRSMWCTAGFLHLAGLAEGSETYRFAPIRVECGQDGRTRWQPGGAKPSRYKFEVTDRERYARSMTAALRSLIGRIGLA